MLEKALSLHQRGLLAEAACLYRDILLKDATNADALHLLGVIEAQRNNSPAALELLDRAVGIRPDDAGIISNRGLLLQTFQRFDEALACFDRALAIQPGHAEILNNRGNALRSLGRLDEALASYDHVLKVNPDHADALNNRGLTLRGLQRFEEALASYARSLAIRPQFAPVYNNNGGVLYELKRFEEALVSYDRALAIHPDYPEALFNRGLVLQRLQRFDAALASYGRVLAIKPDYIEALNERANVLRELKRFDAALVSYDRALAINPDYAQAHNGRGTVLQDQKRFDDALANYERALAIKPDYVEAHYNRGNVIRLLKRLEGALESYERALVFKPDFAEALNNCGAVLNELGRYADAVANYDRALAIKPDYVDALYNRGLALQDLKRFDEALASYDRALAIDPDYKFLAGLRLFCKMAICDWKAIDEDHGRIADGVRSGKAVLMPFAALDTPLSAAELKTCAEIYVRERNPGSAVLPPRQTRYEHERIRLGYFSTDFRDHPVAHAMAELFERHDRNKFELTAFSLDPPANDSMRGRLEKSFHRFIDVGGLSDKDVALRARGLEIDIAIDLNGFTRGNRTEMFAMGVAPIQVNYLGFPGTMGTDYIDYLIADSTLIPDSQQQYYAEKIVYLPDAYMASDTTPSVSGQNSSRAAFGLPSGFAFCCANTSYKIAPEIFGIWMRLLGAVEGSNLWLAQSNPIAMRNLQQEAKARGIDPERIIFLPYLAHRHDHLARLSLADLFLDTLPYNAHATASDALWAGLPILTCMGKTFPGRVAASLLNVIGLPELITQDLDAYEALALALARNPQRLISLRQKLSTNRASYPLFDMARFAKHIESAYVAMWKRHQAGLAPEHIRVSPEAVRG